MSQFVSLRAQVNSLLSYYFSELIKEVENPKEVIKSVIIDSIGNIFVDEKKINSACILLDLIINDKNIDQKTKDDLKLVRQVLIEK